MAICISEDSLYVVKGKVWVYTARGKIRRSEYPNAVSDLHTPQNTEKVKMIQKQDA